MPVLIDISYGEILTEHFPWISWTHSRVEGKIEISQDSADHLSQFEDEDFNQ